MNLRPNGLDLVFMHAQARQSRNADPSDCEISTQATTLFLCTWSPQQTRVHNVHGRSPLGEETLAMVDFQLGLVASLMVSVPIGMDQLENAARCAALGLGVTVRASALSIDAVRAAVREVLSDRSYRENAQRMQREMHALPGPDEVVVLLNSLTVDRRPYMDTDSVRSAAAQV